MGGKGPLPVAPLRDQTCNQTAQLSTERWSADSHVSISVGQGLNSLLGMHGSARTKLPQMEAADRRQPLQSTAAAQQQRKRVAAHSPAATCMCRCGCMRLSFPTSVHSLPHNLPTMSPSREVNSGQGQALSRWCPSTWRRCSWGASSAGGRGGGRQDCPLLSAVQRFCRSRTACLPRRKLHTAERLPCTTPPPRNAHARTLECAPHPPHHNHHHQQQHSQSALRNTRACLKDGFSDF